MPGDAAQLNRGIGRTAHDERAVRRHAATTGAQPSSGTPDSAEPRRGPPSDQGVLKSARSLRRGRLTAATAAAVLVASAGVIGSTSAAAAPEKPKFTLHVLFTNDAESALLGVEGDGTDEGPIVDDGPRPYGSASRMVALTKKLRAEAT